MRQWSQSDRALYLRLVGFARPYWPHVLVLGVLGLLASPIALLNPVPLQIAVDHVLGSQPLPGILDAVFPEVLTGTKDGILVLAVGLLIAITLVSYLHQLGYTLLRTYMGERLTLDFQARLFDRAQRLSLAYHDSTGTADTFYRIEKDAPALKSLTVDGLVPLVSAVVTVVAMLYVAVRIDWSLAVVAMTVVPVLFFLTAVRRRRMRAQSRHVKLLESGVFGVVQESLGALRVVKAFGQETRETGRFTERARAGLQGRIRLAWIEGGTGVLVGVTTAVGMALVLYLGVSHVQSGRITLGQLLLITGYLGQLYRPLKTVSRKVTTVQSRLASAERALALLDEPVDVPERPGARRLARTRGAVAFRGVSFAYDPDRTVLDGMTFEVEPGDRVAITGTTGAGKTTLVSLLMRFYDPTAGEILLDGVDLRDYRLADLRDQFAIVLQDSVLFSTTIAENIAYGRPDASETELVEAARAAGAHEFIERLPDGYGTSVGERGMTLSGGERQRVTLARAFLRDAPILILDEPTSSVDLRTEAAILEAMERLMEGRTVFLITHRPHPLTSWDMHLHVRDGRLGPVPDFLAKIGEAAAGGASS
jgi:ATP-binding cassette subfamily B protein